MVKKIIVKGNELIGKEVEGEILTPPIFVKSEKEKLLDLYQVLKDLGIRSISDLENLIARAE